MDYHFYMCGWTNFVQSQLLPHDGAQVCDMIFLGIFDSHVCVLLQRDL